MKLRTSAKLIPIFLAATAAIAATHTILTFEAPGAGKNGATQQGTLGIGINDSGVIAGITRDANDPAALPRIHSVSEWRRHPIRSARLGDDPDTDCRGHQ